MLTGGASTGARPDGPSPGGTSGGGGPGSPSPGGAASPARWAARVLGALALLLAAFLATGFLLPGTVEVTRSVEIDAAPEAVFPLLNDLEAWAEWTPWGEIESRVEGPSSGPGARRSWDDPRMGSGFLSIVTADPPRSIGYVVEVEDGAIRFDGTLNVDARPGGSTVKWTERVDLGRNPLLGWTALRMDESQGRQLEESLTRLKAVVESR